METFSINQIAEQLKLSESTARRYAKTFHQFLPNIQQNRITRYYPEAIPRIKLIADYYSQGLETKDVEANLAEQFQEVFDVEDVGSAVVEAEQPEPQNDLAIKEQLQAMLSDVVSREIAAAADTLHHELQDLRDDLERSRKLNEKLLKERDAEILKKLRDIQAKADARRWWQFWR